VVTSLEDTRARIAARVVGRERELAAELSRGYRDVAPAASGLFAR